MVQFHFNWDHVSIIASMHLSGVTLRLHDGAINIDHGANTMVTNAIYVPATVSITDLRRKE